MSVAALPLEWEVRQDPVETVTKRRSRYGWVPFVAPLVLTGASWAAGGSPLLTDAAWVIIAFICLCYVIREMALFPQRFGIGGLILYGGTLMWFCYDYFSHWL